METSACYKRRAARARPLKELASSAGLERLDPALTPVSVGTVSDAGIVPSNRKSSVIRASAPVDSAEFAISSKAPLLVFVGDSARVRTPHSTSEPDSVDVQLISVGPV